MKPYPLLFEPILVERVWGGRSLRLLGKEIPDGARIGESWEVSDLPERVEGGRSVIANGPLAGTTLRQAIASDRQGLVGSASLSEDGGFPLLLKYLDARENLSVQVHPDDEAAAALPGARSKSEAWVVLEAEPQSTIYAGLDPEIDASTFRRHIETGCVLEDLQTTPAVPGECHYLPAGTLHALGAGIVVAEIQTPSDTTYRVWDWGRTDRALHIDEALECIHFGRRLHPPTPGAIAVTSEFRSRTLLRTRHFELERLEALRAADLPIETPGRAEIWMVEAGAGHITCPVAEPVPLSRGTTVLLPAAIEHATARLEASASILRVLLPSPIEGAIA